LTVSAVTFLSDGLLFEKLVLVSERYEGATPSAHLQSQFTTGKINDDDPEYKLFLLKSNQHYSVHGTYLQAARPICLK
jgi:hypothetical protein